MAENVMLPTPGERVDAVSAVVHHADPVAGPPVLLSHGAGGDKDDEGLVALATGLAGAGLPTVRANLPYREAHGGPPPRADRSVPGYRTILTSARDSLPALGEPWLAGGKSYGGRVASVAVAAGMEVAGLLLYSYPLHPPGKPDHLRVQHWPDVDGPCCFLQGSRDALCDIDLLRRYLPDLAGPAHLEVVEGGDHSLAVAATHAPDGQARTAAETATGLAPAVARWVAGIVDGAT